MIERTASRWLLVLAIGAGVLAACGGGSSPDDAPDDAADTAPDTSETSPTVATTELAYDPTDPTEAVDVPDRLGSFEVGHTAFEVIDPARDDRTLPVEVWYPVDPGTAGDAAPASLLLGPGIALDSDVAVEDPPVSDRPGQPLVVFSHGYEGINTQSVDLMEALASHGFVVAARQNTSGNSQSHSGRPLRRGRGQPCARRFGSDRRHGRAEPDVRPFAGRIDGQRVGVVGHSFGAMTAIGAAAGLGRRRARLTGSGDRRGLGGDRR